jgi:hypothetical protein
MDRHVVAAEVNHPGTGGTMNRVERRRLQHVDQVPIKKGDAVIRIAPSVLGT